MSLSVRPHIYRGERGFLICGKGPRGHQVKVFVHDREAAALVKDNVRNGRPACEGLQPGD